MKFNVFRVFRNLFVSNKKQKKKLYETSSNEYSKDNTNHNRIEIIYDNEINRDKEFPTPIRQAKLPHNINKDKFMYDTSIWKLELEMSDSEYIEHIRKQELKERMENSNIRVIQ